MRCEFCGRSYNLALSHGLSEPQWRYRLAAHLRADQVEALLPALATTSVLGQLTHSRIDPPLAFGLQLTLEGRSIEVDIAAYLMDPEWLAILGEVKTANRIDLKDVENLELLQRNLVAKGVRCVLLFATLKSVFAPEERSILRSLVERAEWTAASRGEYFPNVPLVLTGPDLSRNFWDEEHPWRWGKRFHAGVLGTALASCERNLGLESFSHEKVDLSGRPTFSWSAEPPDL